MAYKVEHTSEFTGAETDGFVITFDGNLYDWIERGLGELAGNLPFGEYVTPCVFATREEAEKSLRDCFQ